MPNWKKLIVSGSDASLNSLTTPPDIVNQLTASYAINAVTTAINTGTVIHIETPSTTWDLVHNVMEHYPIVTIWDDQTDRVIQPDEIESIDLNTVRVTFTEPVSGYANVSRAGHVVSGSVAWKSLIGPADVTASINLSGSLYADNGISGSFSGSLNGDVTGSMTGSLTGSMTGSLNGDFTGSMTGSLTGSMTGSLNGDFTGSMTGSLTGSMTGSLNGDVTGSMTGSLFGFLTGSAEGNFTGSFTGSLSGSLFGTASYALNASSSLSASYASASTSASYASSSTSASYASSSTSASFASSSNSSSYALVAEGFTSGSKTIWGNLTISGSLVAKEFYVESSSVIYTSGSTKFGDTLDDIHEFTGSVSITGSLVVSSSLEAQRAVLNDLTGSLFGTASYALNSSGSVSASFASTASFITPLKQNVSITGSTGITGSLSIIGSLSNGLSPTSSGRWSHAEGLATISSGQTSHAEGALTLASGESSHAEGYNTKAIGGQSHAEGEDTTSTGWGSHSEGFYTSASADYSHAEGDNTIASGYASHAEGLGTIAQGDYSHVQGKYNLPYTSSGSFIIGNGTAEDNRSNLLFAHDSVVEITGSLKVSGSVTGSLFGTASYALNSSGSVSASYASSSTSASYASSGTSASYASSSTSASYASSSTSASYASSSTSASYASASTSASYASSSTSASYASSSTSASYASASTSASYASSSTSASYASASTSASYASSSTSASYASASTSASYASASTSASYASSSTSASYASSSTSSSYAATASLALTASYVSGGGTNVYTESPSGSIQPFKSAQHTSSIESSLSYSTIAGGQNNKITSSANHSFIGAGKDNTASGLQTFIGAGTSNFATNTNAVVIGGSSNAANAIGSFIGAGTSNTIQTGADYMVIVGGNGNSSVGNNVNSFIGGGLSNGMSATTYGVIVGGQDNLLSGTQYSSLLGGKSNKIEADYGNIIGGANNWVKDTHDYTTIMGLHNTSSTSYQTIIGKYSEVDNTSLFIIGNGSSNTNRKNIVTFSQSGSVINSSISASSWISASSFNGSFTGSLFGTASYSLRSISSSFASASTSASYALLAEGLTSGSKTINGDLFVSGNIRAREFYIDSSSVIYTSGSTKFGNTLDDIHEFTGSVSITGSLVISSSLEAERAVLNNLTGSLFGTASYALNGGVTKIIAGTNITLDPVDGSGQVTINSSGGTLGANETASFSNSDSWVFNHGLNTMYPIIQIVDSTYNQLIPQNVVSTDANNVTITFPSSETGVAIASVGGVGTTAATASYVRNAVTASYIKPLTQSVSINGAMTIGVITGTPTTENTLNVYPPMGAGTGEGGQIMLAASGGLYTSASMLDNWNNNFRILKGTNAGGSQTSCLNVDLDTGNTTVGGYISRTKPVPVPYICQGILSGDQSISNSADNVIAFVDQFDPQNWWNATDKRFQPNIAGYYQVAFGIWLENPGTTTGQTNAQCRKSGTTQIIVQYPLNSQTGISLAGSKIIQMNGTTDYVDFTMYQNSGNAKNIVKGTSDGSGTWFTATLLGV